MKNIGELFTFYNSDKDNVHHYGQYYQKHLPEKINEFLEIGVWKAAGIKSFIDFYNNEGSFHVVNYIYGGNIITKQELLKMGIVPWEGKQEDINFLQSIKNQFTVISEDGSHHSDAQIITFKQMFVNNLEPGGLYILEDVYGHLDGEEGSYWRRGKVNTAKDTIMPLCRRFLEGGDFVSQFFTQEESDLIISMIDTIDIYDDKIIFFKKK